MSRSFLLFAACLAMILPQFASAASSVPNHIALEGTKWTFSFNASGGFVLDVVQDFTTPGVLKTTATCNLSEPITVTVEAPVELQGKQVINRVEARSPKKTIADGSWCMAIIPRRVMDFTILSATQINMNNDPLHPGGMVWTLVP